MHCYVPTCPNSTFKKEKKAAAMVEIYFRAPSDEALFKQWQAAVPKNDIPFSREDKLCDLHFQKSEVVLFTETKLPNGNVRRVPASEPKLKPGTVPSVFPPVSLTASNSSSVEKNKLKRKASALGDSEKCDGTPVKVERRGRPRKHISNVPDNQCSPTSHDKSTKMARIEPLLNEEESTVSEPGTENRSPIIEIEDEEVISQSMPSCSIRLVPLETLMESTAAVDNTQTKPRRLVAVKGTGGPLGKKTKSNIKPLPSTVAGSSPGKRIASCELEDPLTVEMTKIMKGSSKRDPTTNVDGRNIINLIDSFELEGSQVPNIEDITHLMSDGDDFADSGGKTTLDESFEAVEIKAEPEELEEKDSLEELRNTLENDSTLETLQLEFNKGEKEKVSKSTSRENQIREDIQKLTDALTSDDEQKGDETDQVEADLEVLHKSIPENVKEKVDNFTSPSVDEPQQEKEKSDGTSAVSGDNKSTSDEDDPFELDNEVDTATNGTHPMIADVISLSGSISEGSKSKQAISDLNLAQKLNNDSAVEDGRTTPDSFDNSGLKSTPENKLCDAFSGVADIAIDGETTLSSTSRDSAKDSPPPDSEEDPTWTPDEDAKEVSDDNDTDPGSAHEGNDQESSGEKEDTNSHKQKVPKSQKINIPDSNLKKATKNSSSSSPKVSPSMNIFTPETIQQILKQIKLPLTTPVTLKIAPLIKNANGELTLGEKVLSTTPAMPFRKVLPKVSSVITTPEGHILTPVGNKPAFNKGVFRSFRTQISPEKRQHCEGLLGLKMFEGLGQIKKSFVFSTSLTNIDDEVQFKRLCLIIKECFRVTKECKNAKTNIGKLTINATHVPKIPSSNSKTFAQEQRTLTHRKKLNTENAGNPEVLECMTVDSSVENHYEVPEQEDD